MRVAKFWHNIKQTADSSDGRWRYHLSAWGGSWENVEEAADKAQQKMAQWLAKLQRNEHLSEYEYQISEIREELLQEFYDFDGNLIGALTRNRYGAVVLNTSDLLIADIDIQPQPATGGVFAKLGALFGRKPHDKQYHLERLRDMAYQNSYWNLRVYETHSGLRVFATYQGFDPAAPESQQFLQTLGSDPLYQKLCRHQESFRARLTPKPWRCNFWSPPNAFPRQTAQDQANFEQWREQYEAKSQNFAVCRLLETIGSGRMTENARELIKHHDAFVLNPAATQLA